MGPMVAQLSPAARQTQTDALVKEAESTEVGCDIHCEKSVKRLCQSAAIIPPAQVLYFRTLVNKLKSRDPDDMEVFVETTQEIHNEFPNARDWLEWWLQPAIASMIFPAASSVDLDLRDLLPATTNPVEHQHSLLNRAVGYGNDLITGVRKMLKHIQERKSKHLGVVGAFFAKSLTSSRF